MLRGINVGGHNKVKMAQLKLLCESIGFADISTYIQTGNVLFSSRETSLILQQQLEQALLSEFGFKLAVTIRSIEALEAVQANLSIKDIDQLQDSSKLMVSFLSEIAPDNALQLLQPYLHSSERLQLSGTELYLYCPNGYGKTKLTNNLLEKKLVLTATTRNWKTLLKLCQLSLER
ncbi:MAG: hypothetical protein OFPI_02340 [Osedax symbiont Rs2]|nr:MAG: hypothetical protein OFPI_02340 [Osedax symbiont Rs2]